MHIVGIDIGTTGAKAVIFDQTGRVVASGYREYACTYPRPNWVEQDVDLIVAESMEAAKDAVSGNGIDPKDVGAISFSAQRCCTIVVDKSGHLVRPMISWQDNRPVGEVELIKASIPTSEFYRITSLPLNTTWMIAKILWIRRNEPESWKRMAKIVQLQDYALKAYGCPDFYDDYSDAGFYGLWNPYTMNWDERLLGIVGITRDNLPLTAESGKRVGRLSREAAAKTGLAEGTPLCVGVGDQNSAAVGAGIIEKGYLSVSLGTGGLAAAFLDQPFNDPRGMTMVTNHAIKGKWQLEGLQAGAASVFRWFRDEIATLEKAYAAEAGEDVYGLLNRMVEKVPPGSKGLILLPYFASATTPRWNSYARGILAGMTFAHDRNCMARAFMEGITLEVKDMLQVLLNSGVRISTIHILGGPTKSEIWNQMQADVYDSTVHTLKNADAAVLGAAIVAGVGVGMFKDIPDGVRKMVSVNKSYLPVKKHVDAYRELYDIYCRIYEGLEEKEVFRLLAKFQER